SSRRSRQQNGRAGRPPPFELAVRIRDALERIGLPDLDAHVAALDPREELPAALLELRSLANEVEERRPRHVQRAALRELERRERLDRPGRVPERDHHAVRTQAVERLEERLAADRIVDDRHTLAVGQGPDTRDDVVVREQHDVATVRFRDRTLRLAAHDADHACAAAFRPLRAQQADAAGGRVQQDRIPCADAVAAVQQVPRREPLQHHGRRGPVVDRVGQRHEPLRVDETLLGIGVERRRARIRDALPRHEAGDPCADRGDHAGRLAAETARQRYRIEALAVVRVDHVETDRGVAHADFVRARLVHVDFAELQHLRSAELVDTYGSWHASPSRQPCLDCAARVRRAARPIEHERTPSRSVFSRADAVDLRGHARAAARGVRRSSSIRVESTGATHRQGAMSEHLLIVGGGQAAVQAVHTLRQNGFTGRISLVCGERYAPYQRPPLSKKYLAGEMPRERLALRPEQWYRERAVDLVIGARAVELDATMGRVRLDDGRVVQYDALLLATGSRPRKLRVPGAELSGIHYLRTIDDVDAFAPPLVPSCRLVLVGAGYIGLEVAAVAASRGVDVTVLEARDRVMSRVVGPDVSRFYDRCHASAGVKIRYGATVSAFSGGASVEAVETADGERFPCDLAIVGIGVEPNVELAESAGLPCENGIVVDERARTEDPRIVAAGDCTSHPHPPAAGRVRPEAVP